MEYLFENAFNNALVPLAMDEFCANFTNTDGICTTEDSSLVLSDVEEQEQHSLKEPTPPSSPKLSVPLTKLSSISPSSFSVPSSFEQIQDELTRPNPFSTTSTNLPPPPPFLSPIYTTSPSVSTPGTDGTSNQPTPVPPPKPPTASGSKDDKTDKMLGLMKVLSDMVIEQQKKMGTMALTLESLKQKVGDSHGEVMKKLEDVVEEEVVEEHNSPFLS
ncbi:pectinesterase inhibitor 10-like [Beta vulgaris subsp. vulgaris]|uniref:pectinesterase inhibitor 10-like n=1 Tax=Beta vulgaris subsp. vulgaris TaxID=3555 RepID=UPI002548628D|nr:pectinesterase inhibitor 10-like [Beta vulgaris subsp. vulgaris]